MQFRLLAAIWLSAFLVSLDYTAVNVALPTLSSEFNVGTSEISWIALAYMLVVVALTLPAGASIDRLGHVTALTWGLGVFATASLASVLSSTLWALVAMRALQGIGASIMFMIGPAVIKTMAARESQGRVFAIFSTAPTAGLCGGPAIGGQLTELFGWEAIFLFSLATALLAIVLLRTSPQGGDSMRELRTPDPTTPIGSPVSALLAFAGLLALLLGLNQGQQWGWESSPIVMLLAASGVILTGFVLSECRASAPIIKRELLASSDFVAAGAVIFPLLVVFGGGVFLVPFYFEWLRKVDTNVVGLILMVQPISTIAISTLAGFCFPETNRRSLCFAGILLFGLGDAVLAVTDIDTSLAVPVSSLFLIGSGMGLFYPTLIQAAMTNVPDRLAASASGLQTMARALAQLLGVVIFETGFSWLFPTALRADLAAAAHGPTLVDMQSAFHAVFWCGAIIAAAALLPAFWLPNATGAPRAIGKPVDPGGEA